MNGLDPAMLQRVQQLMQENPQLAILLNKPGVMQKLQAIAQNPNDPMVAQQYASDPDVQQLLSIIGPAMGMNQGAVSGMGGIGGGGANAFGAPSVDNAQHLVTYINSETQFFDIVLKSPKDKLVVVDFFATWCGPCKNIAPDFERFAQLYKERAIFIKVDVDKHKSLSQRKNIAAMPTFQFYKGGNKIDELRGANVRKLEELITKHISPLMTTTMSAVNRKPSPYKNFPLHEQNRPVYTKAPFNKMKDKLSQLNQKFMDDEQQQQQQQRFICANQFESPTVVASLVASIAFVET
mmetsp:Transcript_44401/g.73485  ORF Transcript_44401/g.73485 Transcript_44401/m.73485 type:complete len:294 (+) Transcript_44401:35-916(+)